VREVREALEKIPHVKLVDVYYPSKTATIVMEGANELKQAQVEKAFRDNYPRYTVRVFWKK
jgi:copper chaperone CopZ